VRVVRGWRTALAVLAGLAMRAWCITLRCRTSPATRRLIAGDQRPVLFVLWHNRLFASAELSRRLRPTRPLHCLVSASKDGAWLSAFFKGAGLRVVRGSSSRGGREAAAALVDVLRAGHDAGITPDGPRGPIYGFKPGALVVARRARVRVVLLGIHYEQAWSLRSWDRFLIPLPFSGLYLHAVELEASALQSENALSRLESLLRDCNRDIAPPEAGVLVV
jgi:lysophospholipid acyltransferase (LPLAT)-like uncharacterized protein